jgi:hypothetical protein
MSNLTCNSCANNRTTGCVLEVEDWPTIALDECWYGLYEPGSDEADDGADNQHELQL